MAMSRAEPQPTAPARPSVVPPLQPGDRLTRAEFERRFDATPGLKKAELIEGRVYMPPPVSHVDHSDPHQTLNGWLWSYRVATPHIGGGTDGSLRLDLDNMPQPDGYLFIEPDRGGQVKIVNGYVYGAPELVGEVAASTASYDLHEKLHVYRRNGVREYLVLRTLERKVDYFVLRDGNYEPLAANDEGIIRSEALPGLWLDPEAFMTGQFARLVEVMRRGLGSPEHAAFVERLARRP